MLVQKSQTTRLASSSNKFQSRASTPLVALAGLQLRAEFVASPELGLSEWKEPHQYDAVTCMFAIHYFFVSEAALRQLLQNVVSNLKDGVCTIISKDICNLMHCVSPEHCSGGASSSECSLHFGATLSSRRVSKVLC